MKKSRFIATAIPVFDKEAALEELDLIRKEFWNATHNCYAYRLGPDGAEYRFSDDGEPGGTAGKPILMSLQKADLQDVLVVVTRFFGGTKLGTGGLARAYGEAADHALEHGKPRTIWPTTRIRVFTPYDDLAAVRRLLEEQAEEFDEDFRDVVIYTALIRDERLMTFESALSSATSGRAGLVNLDLTETADE